MGDSQLMVIKQNLPKYGDIVEESINLIKFQNGFIINQQPLMDLTNWWITEASIHFFENQYKLGVWQQNPHYRICLSFRTENEHHHYAFDLNIDDVEDFIQNLNKT